MDRNTNDLGKGVARMQIERSTCYLLGYQPTNTAPDGKFGRLSHRFTAKQELKRTGGRR